METEEVVLSDSSDDLPSFKERVERLKNVDNQRLNSIIGLKRRVSGIHSISDSDSEDGDNKSASPVHNILTTQASYSRLKDVCMSSDNKSLSPVHNILTTQASYSTQKDVCMSSEDELPEISFLGTRYENIQHCLLTKKVLDVENVLDSEEEPSKKNYQKVEKNLQKTNKDNKSKDEGKEQRIKIREEKKKQRELDKALKESAKEILNSQKPAECLKNMKIVFDHNILFIDGSQQVFNTLDANNLKYNIEENIMKHSVVWYRTAINVSVHNNEIVKEEREDLANVLLLIIPNEDFLRMVHAYAQRVKGKETGNLSLAEFIVNVKSLHAEMDITCIMIGFEKYVRDLKEQGTGELKVFAKQAHKNASEQAMIELQLQSYVNFRFLSSMVEFGNLLCQFTKAIGEAPLKKEKQLQKSSAFSWYADIDSSCPVKLAKDNTSFIKLWRQQVQQFQNVGPEVAEAIVSRYPSPRLLLKAYKSCSSAKEAENLLQDIVVRRNYGPLGTQKRIGPELSFKLHRFFTSLDSNQLLKR